MVLSIPFLLLSITLLDTIFTYDTGVFYDPWEIYSWWDLAALYVLPFLLPAVVGWLAYCRLAEMRREN